jgi:trimeric autotransporter adhesin
LGAGLRTESGPVDIKAMAAQGRLLYVSGNFTHAGNVPATNIAVWDGNAWSQVGENPPLPNNLPQTLFAEGNNLYAASWPSLWRWNGTNWSTLGTVEMGDIQSITQFRGDIYIAGYFMGVNGVTATNVARWNGTEWSAVNCPFVNGYFPALACTENFLYVGGQLQRVPGGTFIGIARYDGTNWTELGSGLVEFSGNGTVKSLAVSKGQVFAAGYFKTAGGKASYRFASWKE